MSNLCQSAMVVEQAPTGDLNPPAEQEIRPSSKLAALTGLRFFAVLHILVFHISMMRTLDDLEPVVPAPQRSAAATSAIPDVPAAPERRVHSEWKLYRALPTPLGWLIKRSYVSTGLFFLLSGFVLAYLYLDFHGNPTISTRNFLLGRWTRLYPLHVAVLPLLIPNQLHKLSLATASTLWGWPVEKLVFFVLTSLMSLLLVQAWCPEAALTWNFPTWALSTISFFYLMFPVVARLLQNRSRTVLWSIFWLMPVLNLVPTLIFLTITDGDPMTNRRWSELVMRTPLFWLPHFVLAMALCRLYRISRHNPDWPPLITRSSGPGLGDLVALLLLTAMMIPDSFYQTLFGLGSKPPAFLLRHGTLAPLLGLLLYELALERGWLAWLLSRPAFEKLGEASFGIFMLQVPLMIPSVLLFHLATPSLRGLLQKLLSSPEQVSHALELIRVLVTVMLVVGLSLLSLRWFERPVVRWLRRKLMVSDHSAELLMPVRLP